MLLFGVGVKARGTEDKDEMKRTRQLRIREIQEREKPLPEDEMKMNFPKALS